MKNLVLASALILLAATPGLAEPSEVEKCGDASSTMEIVQCLGARTKVWDARLNAAYQKLLSSLAGAQHDKLRAAQRLWIQYRDANCGYYGAGEGTISRIDAAECMRRMTQERAQELEGLQN
jgi:uncharacterized protein YecT (DUF1311 family)